MTMVIKIAQQRDQIDFVELSIKLGQFNHEQIGAECKTDDFQKVSQAIRVKAEQTFLQRNDDVLILLAEFEERVCGYALGRIIHEESWTDSEASRIGLFDELYVDESVRGLGLAKKIIDEMMRWMEQNEISRVKLHAYSWNTHAKRIYEQNGFREYAVSYEKFINS